MIIRTNHIDEPTRVTAAQEFGTPQLAIYRRYEVSTIKNIRHENVIVTLETVFQYRNNNNNEIVILYLNNQKFDLKYRKKNIGQ